MGQYRFLRRPVWFAGHLVIAAAMVTMVLLGHWQLDVSERKGFSLQNFGYALQWWAFTVFAGGMWIKIIHDRAHGEHVARAEPEPPPRAPVTYRRYVMPSDRPADDDPELARYNAYLAALDEESR